MCECVCVSVCVSVCVYVCGGRGRSNIGLSWHPTLRGSLCLRGQLFQGCRWLWMTQDPMSRRSHLSLQQVHNRFKLKLLNGGKVFEDARGRTTSQENIFKISRGGGGFPPPPLDPPG